MALRVVKVPPNETLESDTNNLQSPLPHLKDKDLNVQLHDGLRASPAIVQTTRTELQPKGRDPRTQYIFDSFALSSFPKGACLNLKLDFRYGQTTTCWAVRTAYYSLVVRGKKRHWKHRQLLLTAAFVSRKVAGNFTLRGVVIRC